MGGDGAGLALVAACTILYAQQHEKVPRYEEWGFGGYLSTDSPAQASNATSLSTVGNIGLGGAVEYTLPPKLLPFELPNYYMLGAAGYAGIEDYKGTGIHVIELNPSIFIRMPFNFANQWIAFQPSLGYNLMLSITDGSNDSFYYNRLESGFYVNSALNLDLSLRYMHKAIPQLEFFLTPRNTLWFDSSAVMYEFGLRLGAVWHLNHINPYADEEDADSKLPAPEFTMNVSGDHLTPDGDGENDTVIFTMETKNFAATPDVWNLSIVDSRGRNFRTFKGKGKVPEQIEWDGLGDNGEMVYSRSTYIANFTIVLNQRDVKRNGGLTISSSDFITTGVVLETIVPHHEWKMVVNEAIKFDEDKATFDRLNVNEKRELDETINDVVQQIKNHDGVKVYVQGYANNVSGTKEEEAELVTLSKARADAIVELLVKKGISRSILTAEGMGGANPIASREDKENWWKNRRVEFILKK